MSKDQIQGVIRAILTLAGTYLFGHNLFDTVVNESLWQEVTGGVMVAVSFWWTIKAKALTLEILQSSLLKILMVLGTLLVTSHKITGDALNNWVILLTALIPVLYSVLSKKKSADISSGEIKSSQLSK